MKFFQLDEKPLNDILKADFFVTLSLKDTIGTKELRLLEDQFRQKFVQCQQNNSAMSRLHKAYFLKYDHLLNTADRHQLLHQPGIANKIKDLLLEYNGSLYHMLAFTIMPNHIHLLFKLKNPEKSELQQHLEGVIGLIKEQLNQSINQFLNWNDNLWEEFDCEYHLLKEKEVINLTSYIIEDPVKVGLVNYWKDYPHIFINPDLM